MAFDPRRLAEQQAGAVNTRDDAVAGGGLKALHRRQVAHTLPPGRPNNRRRQRVLGTTLDRRRQPNHLVLVEAARRGVPVVHRARVLATRPTAGRARDANR